MDFVIMTDATANISKAFAADNNITVVPFPYYIDGTEHFCTDIESFDDNEYYGSIRNGTVVITSQINPQRYIEYMEPLLSSEKDILFIGLSSGISGSFSSAQMARHELLEKYPERKICLVDSLGASLGEGMLVSRAVECRKNGMELEETAERILKLRRRIYQVFIVDDLNHLRRTGRLSNISAVFGTVLGIRPLLKGNSEGKIVASEKIKGKKRAIKAMAEKYFSLVKNTDLIGISYAGCKESAEYLISLIKEKMAPRKIWLVKHEPVTGSHIGPGSLALYFEGDNVVREK